MKYQICTDMDGVLCDFVKGAMVAMNDAMANPTKYDEEIQTMVLAVKEELGKELVDKEDFNIGTKNRATRKLLKALVKDNREFWANLDWNPGGREIWDAIKDHKPYILSAPMDHSEECAAGKRDWIAKNLTPAPERIILDEDKWKYTKFDGRRGVLIDDMWFNVRDYRDKGGVAIYHRALPVTLRLIGYYAGK